MESLSILGARSSQKISSPIQRPLSPSKPETRDLSHSAQRHRVPPLTPLLRHSTRRNAAGHPVQGACDAQHTPTGPQIAYRYLKDKGRFKPTSSKELLKDNDPTDLNMTVMALARAVLLNRSPKLPLPYDQATKLANTLLNQSKPGKKTKRNAERVCNASLEGYLAQKPDLYLQPNISNAYLSTVATKPKASVGDDLFRYLSTSLFVKDHNGEILVAPEHLTKTCFGERRDRREKMQALLRHGLYNLKIGPLKADKVESIAQNLPLNTKSSMELDEYLSQKGVLGCRFGGDSVNWTGDSSFLPLKIFIGEQSGDAKTLNEVLLQQQFRSLITAVCRFLEVDPVPLLKDFYGFFSKHPSTNEGYGKVFAMPSFAAIQPFLCGAQQGIHTALNFILKPLLKQALPLAKDNPFIRTSQKKRWDEDLQEHVPLKRVEISKESESLLKITHRTLLDVRDESNPVVRATCVLTYLRDQKRFEEPEVRFELLECECPDTKQKLLQVFDAFNQGSLGEKGKVRTTQEVSAPNKGPSQFFGRSLSNLRPCEASHSNPHLTRLRIPRPVMDLPSSTPPSPCGISGDKPSFASFKPSQFE